ncbi:MULTISPECIES: Na+/H+ antiporter [Sphingobacterium]|jgi:CPA1 family monovalent cation:H+ antiporter|uniref:Na+/H+ antiporter n=1 Tax=Sphingobacterium TaxID=28453 RepID=UPI0008A598A4|nr:MULTISPECIES: Na+/H+ antiporter [Sphingobacterium]OFV17169.1 sodium:proton antiporter [Sphingobacterium sp. HMSC13C05]
MTELEHIIWISIILIVITSVRSRLKLALPILLVIVGLILSLAQCFPVLAINPDIIFNIVLPPILFDAAWNTSIPDFKRQFSKISLLAVGLVLITTTVIAVVVHSIIPGFNWAISFALGAIISPPDAIAATSIAKDLPLSRKLITLLEGESLLNDASALIAFKCAIIALVSGGFSFWNAGLQFVIMGISGVAIGLSIGYGFVKLHRFLHGNSNVETFAVLLLPFATYSLAEHLAASGVLAVVSLGMYISWNSFSLFSSASRLQMSHFWDVIIFILNGLVFLILGMQLPHIVEAIPRSEIIVLTLYGFLIFCLLILIRLIVTHFFPLFSCREDKEDAAFQWRFRKEYIILSWSGMRGVVSLATAFALPLYANNGSLIAQRNTVLFLSFVVIIFTLVIQGISLPQLIKRITPKPNKQDKGKELNDLLIERSLSYLESLEIDRPLVQEVVQKMQVKLQNQREEPNDMKRSIKDIICRDEWRACYFDIELSMIQVQRKELVRSYQKGIYPLEDVRKKEFELDLWTANIYQEMKL